MVATNEQCGEASALKSADDWKTAAQLYAFLGNSLLSPMSQTEAVGIDPGFWESLEGLFEGALADQAAALASYAGSLADLDEAAAVQRISVEYTHLFVGPPRPEASPWETANGPSENTVGFGQATFAMKDLLRGIGMSLQNSNNQYEDHMGIELLYASELCARIAAACDGGDGADGEDGACGADDAFTPADLRGFLNEHPYAWIDRFMEKVQAARPDGYFIRLLAYARGLMVLSGAGDAC